MSGLALVLALTVPGLEYDYNKQQQELTIHVKESLYSALIAGETLMSVLPTSDQGVQLITISGNPNGNPPNQRAPLKQGIELAANGEIALELTAEEFQVLRNGGELRFRVLENEQGKARRFAFWLAKDALPANVTGGTSGTGNAGNAPPLLNDNSAGNTANNSNVATNVSPGGRYSDRVGPSIGRDNSAGRYGGNNPAGNPAAITGGNVSVTNHPNAVNYNTAPYGNQPYAHAGYGNNVYANNAPVNNAPVNNAGGNVNTGNQHTGTLNGSDNWRAANTVINNNAYPNNGYPNNAGQPVGNAPNVIRNPNAVAGNVNVNPAAAATGAGNVNVGNGAGNYAAGNYPAGNANGYLAGGYGANTGVPPGNVNNYQAANNPAGVQVGGGQPLYDRFGQLVTNDANAYLQGQAAAGNYAAGNYAANPGGNNNVANAYPPNVTYGTPPANNYAAGAPNAYAPGSVGNAPGYTGYDPNQYLNNQYFGRQDAAAANNPGGNVAASGAATGADPTLKPPAVRDDDGAPEIRTASLDADGIRIGSDSSNGSRRKGVTIRSDDTSHRAATEDAPQPPVPPQDTGLGWIVCLLLIATNAGIFWLFRIYQIRYRGLLREMRETGNLIF